MAATYDCRNAFAKALEELAESNERIVVVVNDCVGSSKTTSFLQRYPERHFNIGIAEQNMVGIASGLANAGQVPFVCSATCFLTARAMEQIKADVAYSEANVKLCGMSSGVAYGPLGATHHSQEDMAWMRAIANMTVLVPADPIETEQATHAAAQHKGPIFLRLSRRPVPMVHDIDYRFRIGQASRLHEGDDLTLIANGVMVSRALQAANLLEEKGITARVLNMSTVQPIDRDAIASACKETSGIVTIEEHNIHGGLGSAVAEVVVATHPVPMRLLGIPNTFAPTGSAEWILDQFGMSPDEIARTAQQLLEEIDRA